MSWTAIEIIGGFIVQTIIVVAWVSSKLATLETNLANLTHSIERLTRIVEEHGKEFVTKSEWNIQVSKRDAEIQKLWDTIGEHHKEFHDCRVKCK